MNHLRGESKISDNTNSITSFSGKHAFLSNFFDCPVEYRGIQFKNIESAFQAMKMKDIKYLQKILSAKTPTEVKKIGNTAKLREDWEEIKDTIMYEICLCKFSQNEDLKIKLLNTGDCELVEGNVWSDTYWGVCNGEGLNKLGQILMRIRSEFKENSKKEESSTQKKEDSISHQSQQTLVTSDPMSDESIVEGMRNIVISMRTKKSQRLGFKVPLKALVFDCIRKLYFDIMDYPAQYNSEYRDEYFPQLIPLGQIGTTLHSYFQGILNLKNQPFTEKLIHFKSLPPLEISTKSDGIDLKSNTLYEFKTKSKIPDAPLENEFRQALFSTFLFSSELQIKIERIIMFYISITDCKFKQMIYDIKNKDSEFYYDPLPELKKIGEKISSFQKYVSQKIIPPMNDPWVETHAYGKVACKTCPFLTSCVKNGNTVLT